MNKRKRLLLVLLAACLLSASGLAASYIAFPRQVLSVSVLGRLVGMFDENTVRVRAGEGIGRHELEVYWICQVNRANRDKGVVVFAGGRQVAPITPCYGENDFRVVYADQEVFRERIFKFSAKHYNRYTFNIDKVGDAVKVRLHVMGP